MGLAIQNYVKEGLIVEFLTIEHIVHCLIKYVFKIVLPKNITFVFVIWRFHILMPWLMFLLWL